MWYIIIAGCLIIGVFFTSRLRSCNTPNQSENIISSINTSDNIYDTIKGMFSKKQIDKKLKHLAETPPPKNLAQGAMCYKMAFDNANVYEYICPVCNEKTIYKRERSFKKNLEKCRREISLIKGINIKLDESLFCKHCSPKAENPSLSLLVNIAGQNDTTKICNIHYEDIQLINDFLSDKLTHSDDYDFEKPLVNNINRIKELLGLK